ncbi:Uncharacterised protein [Legionella pneumophila]|uniref:Uncharacterized protein n=1 Tax=Legionella pneumophila TaxID=446 RepID=A0A378K442_LEGPN|nr:Uncharacterised protein [Legionella pneumophila]CZJ47824.1 Uncharacterised protein [Legionella pneumophila]CZJ78318.1 Uncharacterised protein [Legionella pneumophila]STX78375.1 Uncharacterised protein [Legionella pneumophila]
MGINIYYYYPILVTIPLMPGTFLRQIISIISSFLTSELFLAI